MFSYPVLYPDILICERFLTVHATDFFFNYSTQYCWTKTFSDFSKKKNKISVFIYFKICEDKPLEMHHLVLNEINNGKVTLLIGSNQRVQCLQRNLTHLKTIQLLKQKLLLSNY